MNIREFFDEFLLMGKSCVYCGREIPEKAVCCATCAKEVAALYNSDGIVGGILYAYKYDGPIRTLIHSFKYDDMPRHAMLIAQLMHEYLAGHFHVDIDLLTFIPIHQNKLRQRGFDQAEHIAMYLGTLMGVPVKKLLVRRKDTLPQFSLSAKQRAKNMADAFVLVPGADIENKNILVVDDIYTTGSTMGEALRQLEGANALPFCFSLEIL